MAVIISHPGKNNHKHQLWLCRKNNLKDLAVVAAEAANLQKPQYQELPFQSHQF
jgi:hypothetical protein